MVKCLTSLFGCDFSKSAPSMPIARGRVLSEVFVPPSSAAPAPPTPPGPAICSVPADIMLVLDGSGSISSGDWDSVKKFSEQLIKAINVSSSATHAGVYQFSSKGAGKLISALSGDEQSLTND